METIELGTMSSRGQICIPQKMRETMKLEEGNKIIFFQSGDSLILKKMDEKTFNEITQPLRESMTNKMKEENVPDLIKRFRKSK